MAKNPKNSTVYILYNTTQKWVSGGIHNSIAAAQSHADKNSFCDDKYEIYECSPILKTGKAEKRVWS